MLAATVMWVAASILTSTIVSIPLMYFVQSSMPGIAHDTETDPLTFMVTRFMFALSSMLVLVACRPALRLINLRLAEQHIDRTPPLMQREALHEPPKTEIEVLCFCMFIWSAVTSILLIFLGFFTEQIGYYVGAILCVIMLFQSIRLHSQATAIGVRWERRYSRLKTRWDAGDTTPAAAYANTLMSRRAHRLKFYGAITSAGVTAWLLVTGLLNFFITGVPASFGARPFAGSLIGHVDALLIAIAVIAVVAMATGQVMSIIDSMEVERVATSPKARPAQVATATESAHPLRLCGVLLFTIGATMWTLTGQGLIEWLLILGGAALIAVGEWQRADRIQNLLNAHPSVDPCAFMERSRAKHAH